MEKIMTYETLRSFAYTADKLVVGKIRGFMLDFYGLGGMVMYDEDPEFAVNFAKEGIVYVMPYLNPWNWMNRYAAAYTDEVLDVLFEHYGLADDTPIVSCGGSMGGLCCLAYCAYAKRTPAACVANCPVSDLPYHFTERPDLPRTLYSAYFTYDGDMKSAMETASPIHLVGKLPRIVYTVFHCEEDKAVNKQMHSDRLVAKMKEAGYDVTYYAVPGKGHCDLTPEMWEVRDNAVRRAILGGI